jgi:hypothetical protein
MLVGAVLAALLLVAAVPIVRQFLAPPVLAVEHWVIYLSLILGAGFGALSGALAGVAGSVARAIRENRPPSTSGGGPATPVTPTPPTSGEPSATHR